MPDNNFPCSLKIDDFARLIGATPQELDCFCARQFASMDLRYRLISGIERDEIILGILKRMDATELSVSGENRQPDWEKGWGENLKDFIESGYDLEKLVPKYFRKNVPIRLFGEYAMPADSDFVLNCTRLFRTWLFRKYLAGIGTIYEFGCGPASHLAYLAKEFPDKKLFGLDWAKPSQEIIKLLRQQYGWDIHGRRFDFFRPDPELVLDQNSAIFTFGALEQIGARHHDFLNFLLLEKPILCINVECIVEFYNSASLVDYLALRYHRRKNYLDGYLSRLQELASEKRIEIIAKHHQPFGNMYDDSHSYIIWKPI